MARTTENEGRVKHTLYLDRGTYAELQERFPELGAAAVIRRLIHHFLQDQRRHEGKLPKAISKQEVNL